MKPFKSRWPIRHPRTRDEFAQNAWSAALDAVLATHGRGALRCSPFVAGVAVQLNPHDHTLFPDVRKLVDRALAVFDLITVCGLAERRARIAEAPGPGLTYGPRATEYAPAIERLSTVSFEARDLATDSISWRHHPPVPGATAEQIDHNRRTVGEIVVQLGHMLIGVLVHCADASDVPPEQASAYLDYAAALLES